jgi:hypothetical protein
MKAHVLSCRSLVDMASMGVTTELEDLLVELTDAVLLAPVAEGSHASPRLTPDGELMGRPDERVLIIIALWTDLVAHLDIIPDWRNQFASVVAYVIDPWLAWSDWPEAVPKDLHCIFVPDERTAERFRVYHGINAQALPLGADVLRNGCALIDRPLDVSAYGRQEEKTLQILKESYNHPKSKRFIYHTTAWRMIRYVDNRRLIWKILHKSKSALCFDVFHAPHAGRVYHHPVIPIRYYEAIAAGTAIIGRHPDLPEMEDQFGWPDATLTLPDHPDDILDWMEEILDDRDRLNRIHQRNYTEAWHRHDWRYRIRDLFGLMGWPLPANLQAELKALAAGCAIV